MQSSNLILTDLVKVKTKLECPSVAKDWFYEGVNVYPCTM